MDDTDEHNAPIQKEIDAEFKKLLASRKRLKALQEGSKEAVTGEQGQTTADRAASTEEQRRASAQQLADAEKELARMDEENAKKKMMQLEQEIAGIEKMKEKYLELAELKKKDLQADLKAAQTRMQQNAKGKTPAQKAAYEEAKKAAEAAQAGLDALDQRISAATADYKQQEDAARKKEAEAKAKSESKYTGFLQDTEKKDQERAAEKAQDQQFDALNKNKTPKGVQALNAFLKQLSGSLEAAKQKYQQMLDQYKGEGSEGGADLTDNEKKQLEAQQRAITEATAKLNSYRDRIGGGIQAAKQKQQTLASFDANTLTNLFSKSGFAATSRDERIAKATEETAKNTKKLTQSGGLLVG